MVEDTDYINLFRAVSVAELKDITSWKGFRQESSGRSLESKLFTLSASAAKAFGQDNFRLDQKLFLWSRCQKRAFFELCEHLTLDNRHAVNIPKEKLQELNAAARVDELTVVS